MRRSILWLGLAFVLIVAALPTLLYPLTRDQGAYAYMADLIMNGGVPYRDAWDVKPPAIYLVYVAAFSLFGRSEFAVRVFELIHTFLTAGLVGVLCWEVVGRRSVAVAAAWLYAISYFLFVHFYAVANPETFMAPLLVLMAYGLLRALREGGGVFVLLSGIAAGWAFWFKPTASVIVLGLVVWWVWEAWRERWSARKIAGGLFSFALGGVLGLLPIGLYLLNHGGRDFVEIWQAYVGGAYLEAPGLATGGGWAGQWAVILRYLRAWQSLVGITIVGSVAVLRCRAQARRWGVLFAFSAAALASVLIQGKLFEYHWIPVLAPAAILGACSLLWLKDWPRAGVVAITIALLLGIGYDHVVDYRRLAALIAGRMSMAKYDAHFTIGKDFSREGTARAAEYLRLHTGADETVLIWGAEPLVNFLAERRSPTRFIFSYMLAGSGPVDTHQDDWRAQFLEEVQEARPAYIVLVENDFNPLSPAGSIAQLEHMSDFQAWIYAEYALETQVEDYRMYRRLP